MVNNMKLSCNLPSDLRSILIRAPHNSICKVPNFYSTMASHQGLKSNHPYERRLAFRDECEIYIFMLIFSLFFSPNPRIDVLNSKPPTD